MKVIKLTYLIGLTSLVFTQGFSQSFEEDLDLLRAKKAFKTKMQDEKVIQKTVSLENSSLKKDFEIKHEPVILAKNEVPAIIFSQPVTVEPISLPISEDRTKVRLAFYVNGEKVATSKSISRDDKFLSFKAYSVIERNELVITEFKVDLIRDGRKIASETLPGGGSIEKLLAKAQDGDQYSILIKEVFEKTTEGHLKTYSKGNLRVNLTHFN